ncbi:MAG: hypothetical protein ACK56I_37140, partial [bacterium]
GPKQGAGLQHEHPIQAVGVEIPPEALTQQVQPLPLRRRLARQPAPQLGILRAGAEQLLKVVPLLRHGGQLGGPPLAQGGAPFALPAQAARLPKHLALQGWRQILLGHPV